MRQLLLAQRVGYADGAGHLRGGAGVGLGLGGRDQVERLRSSARPRGPCRAAAMDCAWAAVGIRCGATTMLRCLSGPGGQRQRLGEELLDGERGVPALVMSPWKAVESRASATTAVVPPPIGRAAVGV